MDHGNHGFDRDQDKLECIDSETPWRPVSDWPISSDLGNAVWYTRKVQQIRARLEYRGTSKQMIESTISDRTKQFDTAVVKKREKLANIEEPPSNTGQQHENRKVEQNTAHRTHSS